MASHRLHGGIRHLDEDEDFLFEMGWEYSRWDGIRHQEMRIFFKGKILQSLFDCHCKGLQQLCNNRSSNKNPEANKYLTGTSNQIGLVFWKANRFTFQD